MTAGEAGCGRRSWYMEDAGMQGGRVTSETEVMWEESEKFQGERGTDRRVNG